MNYEIQRSRQLHLESQMAQYHREVCFGAKLE